MKLTDKDKAAIAHIASASREPHAAMRAEQLITGAKVEFYNTFCNDWRDVDAATWDKETEYRLVYPKIKPAYRVYIDPNGITLTIDRFVDGSLSSGLPDGCEWISDWVEYDDTKQWPTPLVERIAAIDIKAAKWIVDNWDDLVDGKHSGSLSYMKAYNEDLYCCFYWETTPQRHNYWENIYKQLKNI